MAAAAPADLAEFHAELRAVARALLSASPPSWDRITEVGWTGLEVEEALGGADATFAETAVVLQEMGRAAASVPYLAVAGLGVGALALLEPGPDRDDLLRATATGDALTVVALDAETTDGTPFRLDAEFRLHGTAAFVLDASRADRLLVPALDPTATPVIATVAAAPARSRPPAPDQGESPAADADTRPDSSRPLASTRSGSREAPDGASGWIGPRVPMSARNGSREAVEGAPETDTPRVSARGGSWEADCRCLSASAQGGSSVVAEVDSRAGSVAIADRAVLDATRTFGSVVADGVAVPADAVWRFRSDPGVALRRLHDRAAVAVACDSLGLSEAMLDATVAYAGTREQFGRRIGSFQAVKHACADMLVQARVARELVAAAAQAVAVGDPDAGTAAAMAKSFACAAAVEVAGKAMQLHGGMGYTWESGVHLHLKRASLNRSLFGAPARHRARIAARYRDGAP
ncbi:acyl-CoA dehydrogenase family protein [Actinomadura parmotrematis]|uniref:Acyl-CoA dehydrogenase family protein n=1 Tax=Actinomadura parmotrematis TaxID=2864039 RepID=A0ABS7G0Z3_9ACTN|nr:acyl-CoA dehydrogenase family protein [Actinomadura parmotrematis]MBW8486380.1 acyl-CoA dehydrogenase family protein [Actinomadura parmotrematis]